MSALGVLANPKVLMAGGAVAGIAFLAHEVPLVGGDGSSSKDKAHGDSSTINCANTPEKTFAITESPQELKVERGSGHAQTLGYFAVGETGVKVEIVHDWDANKKTMIALGKSGTLHAYNGKFPFKVHGAQLTVTCPTDQHSD